MNNDVAKNLGVELNSFLDEKRSKDVSKEMSPHLPQAVTVMSKVPRDRIDYGIQVSDEDFISYQSSICYTEDMCFTQIFVPRHY